MITPDLPKPKAFLPIDDSDAKKRLVLPDKRIIRRVKKGELPWIIATTISSFLRKK